MTKTTTGRRRIKSNLSFQTALKSTEVNFRAYEILSWCNLSKVDRSRDRSHASFSLSRWLRSTKQQLVSWVATPSSTTRTVENWVGENNLMAHQICKLVVQYYTHVKKLHAKRGVSIEKKGSFHHTLHRALMSIFLQLGNTLCRQRYLS